MSARTTASTHFMQSLTTKMTRRRGIPGSLPGQIAVSLFSFCLWLYGSQGQQPKPAPAAEGVPQYAAAAGEARPESAAKFSIPDVILLDQDGNKIRFYSDLVKGKVVVINTIFTSCTTICPPLGATYSKLQSLLGDRMGKDVRLISVSVDPVTDTPARLKAWAAKFHAGPGWTLVTGQKVDVDKVLRALNAYTPDPQSHSPIVLIGNEATGAWTRAYGLAAPTKLAELIKATMSGSTEHSSR